MKCLQLHSSLLRMHAKPKQQQHHIVQTTKQLWLASSEPSIAIPHSHHFPSLRTKALPLPDSIVVAATSPPYSSDLSAFLPISALLLSVYFLANFIFPEFIIKYFGFDKENEEQKVDDKDK